MLSICGCESHREVRRVNFILLVNNNQLTIGYMIVGVVSITSSFGPVIAISSLPSNLTQTFASGDRVLNLMEEKPEVLDINNKNDFKYEKLDINNLDFKYENELILNDVNLNIKDKIGNSALHYLCEDEKFDFAIQIIKEGGDVEDKNNDGKTPIDLIKSDDIKSIIMSYLKSKQE